MPNDAPEPAGTLTYRDAVREALGAALQQRGFQVLCAHKDFTESHQVAVRVEAEGGGDAVAKRLEAARIVVNKNLLPGDKSPKHPEGIRLGAQELTRVGMGPSDMDAVAEFMDDLLHKGKGPEEVGARVAEFKKGFTKVRYCFGAGEAAYRYYHLVEPALR